MILFHHSSSFYVVRAYMGSLKLQQAMEISLGSVFAKEALEWPFFFTNDSLIFCMATSAKCSKVMDLLSLYE